MDNRAIRSKALMGSIWKFLERIIAQGISMVVSIVIARHLTPDEYSVVGIVVIFFAFADVFISGGFNTALVQKKNADMNDYSSVLILSITVSIICYAILFFSAPWIASIYKKPLLIQVIRVMSLILPVNAIKSILCAYISSKLQFRRFFFATIGGTIVSGVVGIYMAMNGFGPWALVAQQMTNSIIDTVILLLTTKIKLSFVLYFDRVKQLFKYGWKIFVTSLLIKFYAEINPMIVGIKYSTEQLSFYTKANSFPLLISSTCTNTLSAVLFPVLAKYQEDKEALLRYTRRFIRLSSFLIFPMMLGLYSVAENFISLLLTDKWLPAVPFIRVFCIAYMFDVIHVGNCETIKAMGRSDVYLKMEIIKKTCYFIIIAMFVFASSSPLVLSISTIACTFVAIIVNSIPNIKLLGYSLRMQIKDLLPNFISAVVMCIIVMLVNSVKCNTGLKFIIQFLVGFCSYVLIALATKNDSIMYLKELVSKRMKK